MPFTLCREVFQIPQFTQRCSPPDQRPVMEAICPFLSGWPGLKSNRVADVSGKMPIVHPPNRPVVCGNTNSRLSYAPSIRPAFFAGCLVVAFDIAGPDHEDISHSGLCPLQMESGLKVVDADLVSSPRIRSLALHIFIVANLLC